MLVTSVIWLTVDGSSGGLTWLPTRAQRGFECPESGGAQARTVLMTLVIWLAVDGSRKRELVTP